MRGSYENSGKLVKFILRRERIITSVWIFSLVFFSALIAFAFGNIYGDAAGRAAMSGTILNPVIIAMVGPAYGADNLSVGSLFATEMLLFTIVTAAIMNIFFVVRHTRSDEESGRIEIIRSLPVGRLSGLNATMIVAAFINLTLAVLMGIALSVLGIESMGFADSMLYGAALGVSGMFFAAVTAVFSQLCTSSKGAVGYSFGFLGVCYMVRAVGDINNETLSLISPLGIILRIQAYVGNYWQPVFVILLLTAVVALVAYYLNSIRDMDQGFIPAKPGRKKASPMLQSSFGLALRLTRNTLITWAVVMFIFGAAYGSIMGDVESFIDSNDIFKKMLPESSVFSAAELFAGFLNIVLSVFAAVPVISAIIKFRGEEKSNRVENILSKVVSRTGYMVNYLLISMVSSFIMLFVSVYGLWMASSAVMDVPIAFGSMFKAIMVFLPAIWFMIGLTVLIIGVIPKASSLIWAYLGYSFFAVYMGEVVNMPEWSINLSAFAHIPQLPVDTINYTTLAVLTVIAAALTAAGVFFYRRRDVQG